jgi:thiamine-monophosphate kinase
MISSLSRNPILQKILAFLLLYQKILGDVVSLESYFIKQFKSKYIGDDGAIIGKKVYVQDAFFEGVHFLREWFTLKQIAYKSVAVNISDIYAMGASPKYALLTVAIPKSFSKSELRELASGFQEAEKEFSFEIVGGDTISNSKLDISVTVIGETRKPITRKARVGDVIAYIGDIGGVNRDLQKLLKGEKVRNDSRFIRPVLRGDFIKRIAPFISSGMDISDGIFTDLSRIADESRLNFRFYKKLSKNIGCSGEEYQFLFTFRRRELKRISAIARGMGVKLTVIGETTRKGVYRNPCKPHHF